MPDILFDGQYGTGALQLPPDARDWSALLHPGIAQAVHAGPPDVVADLSEGKIGGVYDQDGEGACVAYSESGLVSLDLALAGKPWEWLDAEQFYRRNGGSGQNGIDTRLSLEDAKNNGINRRSGGSSVKIDSYLFVPKTPGLFKDTIMAALSIGKPCVVATLLPQNFGWDSSGPPNPNAYHQIMIVGGDPIWATILNSWSERWGRGGRGRLLWSHLDPSRWDVYSYLVNPIGTLPEPIPPPPPPPPQPTRRVVVTATATGGGLEMLRVGTDLAASGGGFQGTLMPTNVTVYDDPQPNPQPQPDPQPQPQPQPQPNPTPGALQVRGQKWRGFGLIVDVSDENSRPVIAVVSATANGAPLPTLGVNGNHGSVVTFNLHGVSGTVQLSAVADDGRTGTGTVTA